MENYLSDITNPNLRVKLAHPDAIAPTRSTTYAAGYDLYSVEDGVILPNKKMSIDTGVIIYIPVYPAPYSVYCSIRSRSGLSVRSDLEAGAGVIDIDYRQPIKVILRNFGENEYVYKKGDRIAQFVLEIHTTPQVEVIKDDIEELPNNTRIGGFGSTGR